MTDTTAMVQTTALSTQPLDALASDEAAVVVAISGGRGFVSRLASLGFVPGASVTMVHNYGRGPIIVSVHQTHIALGRGQAAKILVHKESDL